MNHSIYIRFTSSIYEDIERGYSIDFRDKSKLKGICAWSTQFHELEHSQSEILEGCKKFAEKIKKNCYGGYGSDSEVAIIKGEYVGRGNDGVLLQDVEVVDIFTI